MRTVYEFTETEAKAYDAMRSVMEAVSDIVDGSIETGAFCEKINCNLVANGACTECKYKDAIDLLRAVDAEQDNAK